MLDPGVRSAVNQFFASLQDVDRQARDRCVTRPRPGGLTPARFAELLVSLLEGSLLLSRLDAHKASLAAAKDWVTKVA